MVKDKKEFAWDSEKLISTIEVSDYEKREVRIAFLKGKSYVVVTTVKKIKDDWKPIKGATFPMNVWNQITDAVSGEVFSAEFGSEVPVVTVKKESKPKAKKSAKESK